jgi:hypothetical protein
VLIRGRGLVVLGLLGCTEPAVPEPADPVDVVEPRVEPVAPERELATARCATTSAIWRGEDVTEPGSNYPITYGFHTLAFRFDTGPHAGQTIDFDPKGELYFSDWQLDIFSPDCRRVLLLQDRFGPYHVVALDELPDYLLGLAEPEAILTGCTGCSSAGVHSDSRWIDADILEYETAACGTSERQRVDLRTKSKCRE